MDTTKPRSRGRTTPPADEVDDTIRTLLRQLTVHQQDFERRLAEHLGTDAAGLAVMNHLGSHGCATPTEIARVLNTSTAATTLVLNRLEAAGHLTRGPHPTDRRKVVLTPSTDTLAAAHHMLAPIIDGVEEIAGRMTATERHAVVDFLDAMGSLYRKHAIAD